MLLLDTNNTNLFNNGVETNCILTIHKGDSIDKNKIAKQNKKEGPDANEWGLFLDTIEIEFSDINRKKINKTITPPAYIKITNIAKISNFKYKSKIENIIYTKSKEIMEWWENFEDKTKIDTAKNKAKKRFIVAKTMN